MNNSENAKEITDVTFSQKAFVIHTLEKYDIDELKLEEGKFIRLNAKKTFSPETDSDDQSSLRVICEMIVNLNAQDEDDFDADTPTEMHLFMKISATAHFSIKDKYASDDSEYLEKLLVTQANVQLTDAINNILSNSELKGDKIPYDM